MAKEKSTKNELKKKQKPAKDDITVIFEQELMSDCSTITLTRLR